MGAYKGAIIEIIKADNVSITYAVKRHFQWSMATAFKT
jgi:hypothetical protein